MNAFRLQVQDMCQTVVSAIATGFAGETFTYIARGVSITVIGFNGDQVPAEMRSSLGFRMQELDEIFCIAGGQVGYPPTGGPMIDDVITDEAGNNWRVKQWYADSTLALYAFGCVNSIAKQLGDVGQ